MGSQEVQHSALLVVDLQAAVLHCSPAFCQWTGFREDEVVGRNLSDLVEWTCPDIRDLQRQLGDRTDRIVCQWRVRHKSTSAKPATCELRLMDAPQPIPIYVAHLSSSLATTSAHVQLDVSAAPASSSPRIAENTPSFSRQNTGWVPFFLLDCPSYSVLYANADFVSLTGHSLCDVVGQPCTFLTGLFTEANDLNTVERLLEEKQLGRISLTCHKKSGEPFRARLLLVPVQSGAKDVFVGVLFEMMLPTLPDPGGQNPKPAFASRKYWRPSFRLSVMAWVGMALFFSCVIISLVAGVTTHTAWCKQKKAHIKLQSEVACNATKAAIVDYLLTAQWLVTAQWSLARSFFTNQSNRRFEEEYAYFASDLVSPDAPTSLAWVADDGAAVAVVKSSNTTVVCRLFHKDVNYTVIDGTMAFVLPYHKEMCNSLRFIADSEVNLQEDFLVLDDGVKLLAIILEVIAPSGQHSLGTVAVGISSDVVADILNRTAGPSEEVFLFHNGTLFATSQSAVSDAGGDLAEYAATLVTNVTHDGRYFAVRTLQVAGLSFSLVHVTENFDDCREQDVPLVYGCVAGTFAFIGLVAALVAICMLLHAFKYFNIAIQAMGTLQLEQAEEALHQVFTWLVQEPEELKKAIAHCLGGLKLYQNASGTPQWPYLLQSAEIMAVRPKILPLGPPGLASFVVVANQLPVAEPVVRINAVMACRLEGAPMAWAQHIDDSAILQVFHDYMQLVTASVKAQHGDVLYCNGYDILAIWTSANPVNALLAAMSAAVAITRAVDLIRVKHHCLGHPLDIHIGLSKGPMLVGSLGGTMLKSFGVLGPVVHMVQDLAKLNRLLGTRILATEVNTTEINSRFEMRVVDWVSHRHYEGQVIRVHEVLRQLDDDADVNWMYSVPWNETPQPYTAAVSSLAEGNMAKAKALLITNWEAHPHDVPTCLLLWTIFKGVIGNQAFHPLEACPSLEELQEVCSAAQSQTAAKGKSRLHISGDGSGV